MKSGETAIGLAQENYEKYVKEGRDLRFYVNVLAVFNPALKLTEKNWSFFDLFDDDNWKDVQLQDFYK